MRFDAAGIQFEIAATRPADKLSEAGGPLDEACEACHLQFHYPSGS